MNSRLCGAVFVDLDDVPHHCDPVAPRVFKVDGRMSVLGDDQSEALVEPPDTPRTARRGARRLKFKWERNDTIFYW